MKRTGFYASVDEMKGDLNDKSYVKSLADKRGLSGAEHFVQPGSGEFWEKDAPVNKDKRKEERDSGEAEQHLAENAGYVGRV